MTTEQPIRALAMDAPAPERQESGAAFGARLSPDAPARSTQATGHAATRGDA